jgi:hypothetical protein
MKHYITFLISYISFQVKNLTPNQAAAQAIQLFSLEAKLCDAQPTKVARTQSDLTSRNNENGRSDDGNSRLGSSKISATYNITETDSAIPKNSRLDSQSTANSSKGGLYLFIYLLFI